MSVVQAIVTGVISLAVIAGVTILTWHGSINGEAAIGIFGTIIGGGGVAAISHIATNTGVEAAKKKS